MYTQVLTRLSTRMDVTVRGTDATFEHTRTYLLQVTVMRVLNFCVKSVLLNRYDFDFNKP